LGVTTLACTLPRSPAGLGPPARASAAVPVLALQPAPDALPHPADGALGAAEPLADLHGRIALQAQLDDRALVVAQAGEQPVDRLGQLGRLIRCRLPAGDFQPGGPVLVAGGRGDFPSEVAATGAMVRDPLGALAQGDQGQEAPQAPPVADLDPPLAVAEEEALVGRLDDVLGIDLAPERGGEPAAGQGDELRGEAPEELAGRDT